MGAPQEILSLGKLAFGIDLVFADGGVLLHEPYLAGCSLKKFLTPVLGSVISRLTSLGTRLNLLRYIRTERYNPEKRTYFVFVVDLIVRNPN